MAIHTYLKRRQASNVQISSYDLPVSCAYEPIMPTSYGKLVI
jgi:hypothetical protein